MVEVQNCMEELEIHGTQMRQEQKIILLEKTEKHMNFWEMVQPVAKVWN